MPGKHHDLILNRDLHVAATRSFYLDIEKWKTLTPPVPLVWHRVRFNVKSRFSIPWKRGIYMFGLVLEPSPFPSHGYLMYVGISGDTSGGTLRRRFSEYLAQYRNANGRAKVFEMMARWHGDLFFNYAVLDDGVDLKVLEKSFIKALRPPVNTADFEFDTAAAIKASAW